MGRRGWMCRTLATLAVLLALVAWGGSRRIQAADDPSSSDMRLSPRLLRALAEAGSDDVVPVIVTTVDPVEDADETNARAAGGEVHRRYGRLNGYAATVPVRSLRNLAKAKGVDHISFDVDVHPSNDLNYRTVGADLASVSSGVNGSGLDGSGVTVAVVDSGIASHPDLGGRLAAEVEIVGHEKGFADYYGHGTHVAGIIAGDGSASSDGASFRKFNGIAPKARLISVRVLDANGGGRVSDLLAGIDWVISNKDLYRIRVMNLSLGHPVEESFTVDPLCRAVERAWRAGIVVVAAAGNDGAQGYATVHSPGNDPYVITVGASNNVLTAGRSDDVLTSYTSRGPTFLDHVVKPDLVAPGNRTLSLRAVGSTLDNAYPALRVKQGTFRDDPASASLDSAYFQMSGSSMAAGVVSGMAALMIQANPGISPDTLKARLMKSAEKRLTYDIFSEGAGFADLVPALSETGVAAAQALSPVATWTDGGILIQETGDLWQDGVAWGGSVIWGSDPLRGTGGVWSDSVVWGGNLNASSSLSGSSIVWGGNGKSTSSANSIVWGGNMGANSIVWGGNMSANSIVWGGNLSANSIVWGGNLSASSIVWGGNLTADSIVWGGNVTADSIVWGGNIQGDDVPSLR